MRLGGDDPLTRFKVQAVDAVRRMEAEVEEAVRARLDTVRAGPGGAGLAAPELEGPASTWTYLVNDDPFRNQLGSLLTGPGHTTFAIGAALFATPLLLLLGIVDRWFRKRPRRA